MSCSMLLSAASSARSSASCREWVRLPASAYCFPLFRSGCDFGDRSARGHLLRRHVRRLDDFDTDAHSWRGGLGHDLHRRLRDDAQWPGRAGLAVAAVGSYIAGTVSVVALMFLAPPLASFALRFGPPEYFTLLLLGLLALAYMSSGSMLKALAMAALGLLLGMIGIDPMTGFSRFSYGLVELGDGIGVVPVAVGLFGLSEILLTAGQPTPPEVDKPRLRELLPSREEWRASLWPIGRGTVLGFLIGIIPGSAHIISSFVSYRARAARLPSIRSALGMAPSRALPGRSRRTTRQLPAPLFPCSRWACRQGRFPR